MGVTWKNVLESRYLSLTLTILVAGLALFFLLTGRFALAIAFAGYDLVVWQSRVRLDKYIHGFPGAPTLRRFVRSLIFLVPLPFIGLPAVQPSLWGILSGMGCGICLLLFQFPTLKLTLSREFISLFPPLSREDKIREIFHPLLAAAVQEYLYRGVLLYLLSASLGWWAILLVTVLFVLEHLLQIDAWQNLDRYDLLFQSALSLSLGCVFFLFHSLIGCMLGHMIYNLPKAITAIRRPLKKGVPNELAL